MFGPASGVFLALALAGGEVAMAAQPPARANVRHWGIDDGLPQSSVTGIAQSRDGYLWMTTFGGIARFDGARFVVFDQASNPEMPSNRFVGVVEDRAGDLWFSTEDQALLRLRDGHFDVVAESAGPWASSPSGIVVDGAGTVWAVVSGGLVRVEGDRAVPVPEALAATGGPFRLQTDADGGVWLQNDAGALCWEGACRTDRTLARPDPDARLEGLLRAPGGGAWLASWSTIPPCAGHPAPPPDKAWLQVIRWAGEDWCGAGGGLLHAGTRLNLARESAPGTPPTFLDVRALLVDHEGALWVGTIGGGLFQLSEVAAEVWGPDQGLPSSAQVIVEDRQARAWIASEHTILLVRGSQLLPTPPALAHLPHIRALALDPSGDVWIADELGLARYFNDETIERIPAPGLAAGSTEALLVEGTTSFWVGGTTGLSHYVDGAVREQWGAESLGGAVTVLRSAGDSVWAGTREGVVRVRRGELTTFGPRQGLPRGLVRDVLPSADGSAWVGSYGGGLTRIRADVATRIGTAEGLCEGVASRLLTDDQGFLWSNGNRGVSRIRLAELEAVADGARATVRCDLLKTGEGNGGSGVRASDGSFWFPTVNGAVRVVPDRLPAASAPLTLIEELDLDGQPLSDATHAPPGRGELTVRYTAPGLSDDADVRFQTRLLGLRSEWKDETGVDRTARYTNLKPGEYRFEVRARRAGGDWGEAVARAFSMAPLWYQRPAVGVGIAILALLLGWGAMRLRVRDLRRHTEALEAEVSDRRRVEGELREREAHYRTLFQRTTDGLFVYTADAVLLELNPAGIAMVGLEAPPPAGDPLTYMSAEAAAAVRALIAAAAEGDTMGTVETTIDGPAGPVDVVMEAAQLDRHGLPGALLSARDVTAERTAARERHRLEAELQQAQKLEALGRLAGGIAHDFNNLLTVIRIHTTLLGDNLPAEASEDLGAIGAAVDRAQGMTSKLLVFARRRPASAQVVDLRAAVDATLAVVRRAVPEDVRFVVRHHDFPLMAEIDPVRLDQIIMNLVLNARDALVSGGTITVTTDMTLIRESEAERQGVTEGFYAALSVADDGVGMTDAVRERIFDPFFTTKDVGAGTGLGLSTVHGAVREANGFIGVRSVLGKGTTFSAHLPLATAQPVPEPPPARDPGPVGHTDATILVCDDEPTVLAATALLLRRAGYRVVTAAAPAEALPLAAGASMLITDVVMPGMNGRALAEAIQRVAGPIPVLFVSGHTHHLVEERGISPGSDLLWKPFTRDELLQRVAMLLG